ncbi:MAG: chemotaxis protein CheA [Chloroflexi bacterium]|nr:chemotaxis protein CheA [Chloroflexota bacterium]
MQTNKPTGIAFDISRDELPIFLAEVDEHLQALDNGLLHLQQEEANSELVQIVFRSAHTIKGMAGMIGHHRMTDVTHALENALDGVRKNSIQISTRLINLCLDAVDCLRMLREEVATSQVSGADVEEIVSALRELVEEEKTESAPETAAPLTMETETGSLQGKSFQVRAKIDTNAMASAARAFQLMMALQDLGAIQSMSPSQAEIETASSVGEFAAMVVTDQPFEKVSAALTRISGVDEISINGQVVLSGGVASPRAGEKPENASQPQVRNEAGSGQPLRERRSADPSGRRISDLTLRMNVEHMNNLMNLVGELIIDRNRLKQIHSRLQRFNSDYDRISEAVTHLGQIADQLQEEIMRIRMLPIGSVFSKFPRMVHDMSQRVGKLVSVAVHGEETRMDRSMIDEIYDPLIHLIRNSVDHGIETPQERLAAGKPEHGTVTLTARHEQGRIVLTVEDDGRGIDGEKLRRKAVQKGLISAEDAAGLGEQECVDLMFLPGLSTVENVTEFSGRGVGLDIVRNNIQRVNGSIQIETRRGLGTRLQIVLPLTLAIIPSLLVSVQGAIFALPMVMITETARLERSEIRRVNQRPVILLRGNVLPLVPLADIFNLPRAETKEEKRLFVVVIQSGNQQIGLIVDSLIGEEEVVVKSLGAFVGDIPGISSATILGDGRVALIVDVFNLFKLLGM